MRKILLKLGLVLLSLQACVVSASPDISHISRSEKIELKSKTGAQYDLLVVLPSEYNNTKVSYPVLYFLDAYWDTTMLYSVYEMLRIDNLVPDLILVGVSYPDASEQWPRRRLVDFTPVSQPALPGSGGAGQFLEFLTKQAFPTIEQRFRINPKERAFAGHSLGGLFAMFAVFENPELFNRVLAMSPAVLGSGDYLLKREQAFFETKQSLNLRLFLSHGSAEPENYVKPILKFKKQVSSHNYKALNYQASVLEGVRHTSARLDGYLNGLPWLYADLAPKEPTGFAKFIKDYYTDP